MSEERLNEIKDSVNFQRKLLLEHNMNTLCVDEEQELIEEIDRLNNNLEMIEEENKILKGTILKALEFINNHTYRWKDTQFGEMVEVEDFEPGLKPIELINILKNEFENKKGEK